MTSVAEHIIKIKSELPDGVNLVAVSKYHPIEQLKEAYTAGQRLFGESHAQELVVKAPQMPDDVQWHFIGHLQRNKVRAIMPIVSLIHSVDSIRLLDTIEKEAKRIGRCASPAPCGKRGGEKRIHHRRTALAGTKRRIQEIRECEIPWSDGNGYIHRRRIHHQSRICIGWRNLPNSAQRKHIPHRHLHGNKHGNEPRLALGSGRRGNFGAYRNRNFRRTPI